MSRSLKKKPYVEPALMIDEINKYYPEYKNVQIKRWERYFREKIEKIDEDTVKCTFHEDVRAITPGQSVVFYQNDYVFGGGTIK